MGKNATLRLYLPSPLREGAFITAEGGAHHYLANVMRASAGRAVFLFNNEDGEYITEITELSRRHTVLAVKERVRPPETPPPFTVCLSPLKPEATRFAVQKITELGAAAFVPLLCARTSAKPLPAEKLRAIAAEAAEQCERVYVPDIAGPVTLSAFLAEERENALLLHCDETGGGMPATSAPRLDTVFRHTYILIGPEGGFDDGERAALAASEHTEAISLGPRILKAETAAIAALVRCQLTSGDWDELPRYGRKDRHAS